MCIKAYGYPDVDPIAVIASFSTQGRVKPIYIQKMGPQYKSQSENIDTLVLLESLSAST